MPGLSIPPREASAASMSGFSFEIGVMPLPGVTSDPSACVTRDAQGNALFGADPLPPGSTASHAVRM